MIPVYVRNDGEIKAGDNWIAVLPDDKLISEFHYDKSLVEFTTPKIAITQPTLDSGVNWRNELEEHFMAHWHNEDPEIYHENNEALKAETIVYDERFVGDIEIWIVSYIGGETVICLGHEL